MGDSLDLITPGKIGPSAVENLGISPDSFNISVFDTPDLLRESAQNSLALLYGQTSQSYRSIWY